MECVDSFWNSGEAACADDSPDRDEDVATEPAREDNFRCTFFRQPKLKYMLSNGNAISFDSFDIFTDSESELDEDENATEWRETVSANSNIPCTIDDQISEGERKTLQAPRVTFDRTLCVHSDSTGRFCTEKQLMKEETDDACRKVIRLTKKKNYLVERGDTRNRNYCDKYMKDARNTVHGTKRSHELVNIVNENTCKRRKTIENRIVRNKRLLKSVEQMIRTMGEQESIKPRNKVAETNLVKTENRKEEQSESPKMVAEDQHEDQPEEPEMQRPVFKKRELEKLLDESMHRAIKMYRTCRNTWDDLKKEKSETSQDLSGKKTLLSWLPLQNCFAT